MLALGAANPDRIGAVRLALCRRQHPAPIGALQTFDAVVVRRRSSTPRSIARSQRDEIAAMGDALEIFRASMIKGARRPRTSTIRAYPRGAPLAAAAILSASWMEPAP